MEILSLGRLAVYCQVHMNMMQRPVQVRHDSSDNEAHHSSTQQSSDNGVSSEDYNDSDISSHGTDEDTAAAKISDGTVEASALSGISFGVLAEAQERFPPRTGKRKLPPNFDDQRDPPNETLPQRSIKKESSKPSLARPSKHAPTILSSKQQISRRRDVFEPSPAIKFRDPRFDPTVQSSNHDINAVEKANRNYSFLTSYQAAEVLELKSQIKKTKDPDAVADLKRRVMAIENKVRSVDARQRARDVVKQHKQKEKELIRTGQKSRPYYLKSGQVKKLAETERLESMTKKARDKALQRKQKREKSKEARQMPRVRRE